jgi:hypothetical protein
VPLQASKIFSVEFSRYIKSLRFDSIFREEFKPSNKVFGLVYKKAYTKYITISTKILLYKLDHFS